MAIAVALALGVGSAYAAPQAGAEGITKRLLGTWNLDTLKSTFGAGGAPVRSTVTFEAVPNGIKHMTTTTQGNFGEQSYTTQYVFKVDGKEYPADPAMPVNTVSFKQVDANTLERSGTYQGKVIETVMFKLSPDGKTLTITDHAMTQGVRINNTEVFERASKS